MPPTATFHTRKLQRGDGRELVIFESIVAFLALLLIISGFTLYVGHAFSATEDIMPSGAVKVSAQLPTEPPLSLVEA
ncbi:hypothetical protein [Asticcacaulis taihuensis]|uniref:hypothetical protein n=1 Tax=Asticcacaulis taihuensis TaxID=260084 RepID=UPI003F7B85FA